MRNSGASWDSKPSSHWKPPGGLHRAAEVDIIGICKGFVDRHGLQRNTQCFNNPIVISQLGGGGRICNLNLGGKKKNSTFGRWSKQTNPFPSILQAKSYIFPSHAEPNFSGISGMSSSQNPSWVSKGSETKLCIQESADLQPIDAL